MNKAVFLDRDGTINVEKNYLHKIEEFEFIPGVMEGLKYLQDAGFILVVITNQSGIGRGYYSEKDFMTLNEWMLKKLKDNGLEISGVYYCPHLPDAKLERYRKYCNCRKPALGLFYRAIEELDIDIDKSFAIGDKIRDLMICEESGCTGYLVGKNEVENIIENVINGQYKNIKYANNLIEAARKITEVD